MYLRRAVLNFDKTNLVNIFSFVDCFYYSEKSFPDSKMQIFSSRSFVGLDFSFKYLTHFYLNFVIWISRNDVSSIL